ncbi:MAG: hypothetical protein AB1603_00730 [Chloroflexota bacterium]
MEKKFGGQQTERGVYVSLCTGELITVPSGGGALPGEASITYVRTPTLVAAVLGPFVGLAYVIFLPLIGIVTVVWFAARQLARGTRALGYRAMQLTTAEWQPGMSFFARRRQARERKTEASVEETKKEIAEKKQEH